MGKTLAKYLRVSDSLASFITPDISKACSSTCQQKQLFSLLATVSLVVCTKAAPFPDSFKVKNVGISLCVYVTCVYSGDSPGNKIQVLDIRYLCDKKKRTLQSVQFSHSVVSHCLRPHGLQHARPPCPSPSPRVYSNSCPLSQWCHPTISSSVILFSSCLQSFPASGSFQMSQLFTSGGQSIGVSASAPVLPMNTQEWSRSIFRMDWLDLLVVQGTLKSLL